MWKLWTAVLLITLCGNVLAQDYRLPLTISPSHYTLTIQPYLLESDGAKQFTFDGEVTIEFTVNEVTNKILMHSKNLQYITRELWTELSPSNKIQLNQSDINTVTDIVTYTLGFNLEIGAIYYLHFVYTGIMADDMLGFYRSSYTDSEGTTKWIGSTQFQTNHARRAFPCFDEPKFKATFQVNIIRLMSMNSYSNTRSTTTAGATTDYEVDAYPKTPKMSTYLLAFIISEFRVRGDEYYGVIARPELYDQTEYAYTIGQKTLKELENYFDIQYNTMGVDKMHMAAIPDFDAGAMENWGLLTYRERLLLYALGSTTLDAQQSIAAVIAHEQTHMWFGDLVTCDWWSYTWLNEGFARYFQYHATHNVEPQWEMDKHFLVSQTQVIMNMDATNATNPMSDEDTNTPSDLSRMFNSISYNKGGTFVRSIKYILGEKSFQTALQQYLNARRYTNVVPQNLFDYLSAHWPIKYKGYDQLYFESFTEQVGFPVITINLAEDGNSFTLSQKRFLLLPSDGSDASLLYTLPISYTTDLKKNFSNTAPEFFLPATTNGMIVNLAEKANWLIVNIQGAYYYRVNYDKNTWNAIGEALTESNWGGIHELNRAQICDDLLNLARSNEIDYEYALNVLEYLSTETNYFPWKAAFTGLDYLSVRLGTNTEDFASYILRLTERAYNLLGFEELSTDTPSEIILRSSIIAWSCKYGKTDCIERANGFFTGMVTNDTAVPVNIRGPVYCTAMRNGNTADYNRLYNKYLTETSPTEKTLILSNLGCVNQADLVELHFNNILSENVRRQDRSSALSSLYSSNNENVYSVYKLMKENYAKLIETTSDNTAATSFSSVANLFTEESQAEDFSGFINLNKAAFNSYASKLEAAERKMRINLDWDASSLPAFKSYLQTKASGGALVQCFTLLNMLLLPILVRILS